MLQVSVGSTRTQCPQYPSAQRLQLSSHLLTAPDDTAAQVATGLGIDHRWGVLLALQVGEVDPSTLSFLPEAGEGKKKKGVSENLHGTRFEEVDEKISHLHPPFY